MQNQQGDIRGYKPQPTGQIPVMRPPVQQPAAPYPPQPAGQQPSYPQTPPPGYVTGAYQPVPPQADQPTQPIRAFVQGVDWNVMMLLASAVLGLVYALVVTITLSRIGKLVPHMVFAWLSPVAAAGAGLLRQRWFALGAAIGYVIAMLLFLNYFYWLLIPAILCGVAFMRMEE